MVILPSSSFRLQNLPVEIQEQILRIVLRDTYYDNSPNALYALLEVFPSLVKRFLLITDDYDSQVNYPDSHLKSRFPQLEMRTLKKFRRISLSENERLPPIRLFHFYNIERSLDMPSHYGELSLWRECLYERFVRKDDMVCVYVFEAGSIAKYLMEKICKRKQAMLKFYTDTINDRHYRALDGSSEFIRGKNPYEKHLTSTVVPVKPWRCENRRFALSEAKDQWTRVDLTECMSVESISMPHVLDFRVVMRQGCTKSRGRSPCVTPRVEITAPALDTFHLVFDGGKLPAVSNASWGYQSKTSLAIALQITNSSYLEQPPFGRQCTHHISGGRSAVSCDWTRDDKVNFRNFTSNFIYLELLGVPDEVLRLTSWERVYSLSWERLPLHSKEANDLHYQFEEPQYERELVIPAPVLGAIDYYSVLDDNDPVPRFAAPMLRTVFLTALKGSNSVWDFDRVFQSYGDLKHVTGIFIIHPSGSDLKMKPFRIPGSINALSIWGCHAPWLFSDEIHGSQQFVLPNLTDLTVDISHLEPDASEISLDISRKYPLLKKLVLMAQLCWSQKFEGADGRGIELNLVTSKTIRSLEISASIGISHLTLNGNAVPLSSNPCPKALRFFRVWNFNDHAEVMASVTLMNKQDLTDDYW